MCASLVKVKILQKSHFLKDIFRFLANCHSFQNSYFPVAIFSFLKKYLLCLKSVSFGGGVFFWQKMLIYAKSDSFWANE